MLVRSSLLHINFYKNNNINKHVYKTPSFTSKIEKDILKNGISSISNHSFKSFFQKLKKSFNGLFIKNKKNETKAVIVDNVIQPSKLSKAKTLKNSSIPKNGVIVRQGYEEHYQNGYLVKKVLLPDAYQEHTLVVDSIIEYEYKDGELVQMRYYHKDLANEQYVKGKQVYTNLGDLSIEQIRDL